MGNYFPVLVFLMIGVVLGLLPIGLGWLLSIKRPSAAKLSPYECGFEAFSDARLPFDVRFYLVAILFIIFDLETAFLFPWAILVRHLSASAFWGMMIFLFILLIGFIYEWKRGALEWQ